MHDNLLGLVEFCLFVVVCTENEFNCIIHEFQHVTVAVNCHTVRINTCST